MDFRISLHKNKEIMGSNLIAVIFMIGYTNFYALTSAFHLNNTKVVMPAILVFSVACAFCYHLNLKFYVSQVMPPTRVMWFFFLAYQLVFTYSFSQNFILMARQIMCWLIWCIISLCVNWDKSVLKWIIRVGYVNVIATLFLFIYPGAYSFVIKILGTVPAGTDMGAAGYRAGITDNYSQNGIFISMVVMALGSIILMLPKGKKIEHKKEFVLLAFALIALLLTSKRGVLIYSAFAFVVAYCLADSRRLVKKGFRVLLIAIFAIALFWILAQFIQPLSYVIDRFQNTAEDNSTEERLTMWNLAITMFKKHPFLGCGTYSFRSTYASLYAGVFHYGEQYALLNAHNTYLQVLAENGIVGFIMFISTAGFSLYRVIRLNRMLSREASSSIDKMNAFFSFVVQLYVLMYCFFGNCLYDIVFSFYCCALVLSEYLWFKNRRVSRALK